MATETPSLVTLAPNDRSMATLRPLGPSVTPTVFASVSIPRSMLSRASNENLISLAVISFLPSAIDLQADHGDDTASLGCVCVPLSRQAQPIPDVRQCLGEMVDHRVVVAGRRRDAQPLGAAGHGRVVDRLDIDAVLVEQQVARRLAVAGSPTISGTMWVSVGITGRPAATSAALHASGRWSCWRSRSHCEAFRCRIEAVAAAQMRRRQGGGEDEARAHRSAPRRSARALAGDIAADAAEAPWPACPRSRRSGPSTPSRSAMPPPRGPYMPTACTSSR